MTWKHRYRERTHGYAKKRRRKNELRKKRKDLNKPDVLEEDE